jgi:release factor glutamine methyltransferase
MWPVLVWHAPHWGVAVPCTADGVVQRLVAAGCVAADEEAGELLAAAPDPATLEAWLRRREDGEPLAWITGALRFCGLTLHVAAGVYVPRIQSEDLARHAAAVLPRGGRAVDLCTGAGAIAAFLTAQDPTATVVGVDIDVRAAACARGNGVRAVAGDLDGPIRGGRRVDVVAAVAPYVPSASLALLPADVQRYEPRAALDGGEDGLDVVRRVVAAAGRLLRTGGWLLVEVGGTQDLALAPALAAAGFAPDEAWWDEDGDLRGLAVRATTCA